MFFENSRNRQTGKRVTATNSRRRFTFSICDRKIHFRPNWRNDKRPFLSHRGGPCPGPLTLFGTLLERGTLFALPLQTKIPLEVQKLISPPLFSRSTPKRRIAAQTPVGRERPRRGNFARILCLRGSRSESCPCSNWASLRTAQ